MCEAEFFRHKLYLRSQRGNSLAFRLNAGSVPQAPLVCVGNASPSCAAANQPSRAAAGENAGASRRMGPKRRVAHAAEFGLAKVLRRARGALGAVAASRG